ncbi:DUF6009 family protein [Nostoc sp. XA010]|jgi:hypothetical protein|uniref:DUF6009 family protein n=1 Tax=Nostoc sp. XA010 TaxID=2780407 RepID=UPI001E65508E|nr:DUF6009 family protein [Nostoc sp. XA010]MCC5661364.1 DUF6009 family protein [Nostoc sp. XA010]
MSRKATVRSDIEFESNIKWLRDIKDIPYVREHFDTECNKREGLVKYQGHEIVGYAELEKNAPKTYPGKYSRRIFWLSKEDRFYKPDGAYKQGCPSEAIDPLTVSTKVLGRVTERAWGGTLPPNLD